MFGTCASCILGIFHTLWKARERFCRLLIKAHHILGQRGKISFLPFSKLLLPPIRTTRALFSILIFYLFIFFALRSVRAIERSRSGGKTLYTTTTPHLHRNSTTTEWFTIILEHPLPWIGFYLRSYRGHCVFRERISQLVSLCACIECVRYSSMLGSS